ncbi:aldo/keto reductase [Actinoplanes sp. TBRC 11911]|uniref:aldo/keto reductase n=1 Tax=Actinoplanes sp. TBRC 11911 TaxID=2729386 RepID=UPI00145FA6D4|nr:aldo/keto reductase [Actinoplanes sp. TBRC 11911]NMO55396.1 aldo/keto reductase [Actinoplanes sp. TBRC 11911]
MKHRILGGTGMSVSEFALGTMMLGSMGNSDHDESVNMIHTALDAGINVIDTADVYSAGESETIVGKAIKGRRAEVILATKFSMPMGTDGNSRGGSRRWIMQAVEGSLRRLGTDYIDLYQMHRWDPVTDLDETLSALSDLIQAGKVRAIGSSLFHPEQIVEAQWLAERRNYRRIRSEQPPYNILLRGIEGTTLPTAHRYGMGVLTFGPLGSGWLSGRADPTRGHRNAGPATPLFDPAEPGNQAKAAAVAELAKLAAEAGMTMPHLALAFVLSHPAVTSVLIGPRTPAQLADLLSGVDIVLPNDVLDAIDEIVPPGVNLNQRDILFQPSTVGDKHTRRRMR